MSIKHQAAPSGGLVTSYASFQNCFPFSGQATRRSLEGGEKIPFFEPE